MRLKLTRLRTRPNTIGYSRLVSRLLNKEGLTHISKLYYDKINDLGLLIDNKLTWNHCVSKTCNRVFAGVHSLKNKFITTPYKIGVAYS